MRRCPKISPSSSTVSSATIKKHRKEKDAVGLTYSRWVSVDEASCCVRQLAISQFCGLGLSQTARVIVISFVGTSQEIDNYMR